MFICKNVNEYDDDDNDDDDDDDNGYGNFFLYNQLKCCTNCHCFDAVAG